MKAIICPKFGSPDVLRLADVEKPNPKDDEVLIKIHATTVCTADCDLRGMKFPIWLQVPLRLWLGPRRPNLILGQELAGEVEAAGSEVRHFKPGDKVYGLAGLHLGAHAEYICMPEKPRAGLLGPMPANLAFTEAAPLAIGAVEAMYSLRNGAIRPGDKVLIVGAGGSIGTFAIQLARHYGAEVTGVDSAGKLDTLRALGASRVIDYARQDFTQSGETYDVIFDVVGKSSFSGSLRSLKPNGRYLLGNPGVYQSFRGRWTAPKDGRQVLFRPPEQRSEDLVFLNELIQAGKLKTVIDRTYPLEQIAEAHRYVDSGQKKGSVVITV